MAATKGGGREETRCTHSRLARSRRRARRHPHKPWLRHQLDRSTAARSRPNGSSPARLAGDGRYFGLLPNGRWQVTTSRRSASTWLSSIFGKSVQNAAEDDGAVAPGEPVSNDHYERNPDARANALTVADDASSDGSSSGQPAHPVSGTASPLPVRLRGWDRPAEPGRVLRLSRRAALGGGRPVWVTIQDGLVTRIDEQYFP